MSESSERTEKEICEQIILLEEEKATTPKFDFFNEDTWEIIDLKISILKGEKDLDDYQDCETDEEIRLSGAAEEAQQFLDGEIDSLVE